MNAPYRNVVDPAYNAKIHNRVRWKKIADFLPKLEKVEKGLDVGDWSAFTDILERFYNCRFDNATGDLDTDLPTGDYGIITCFDVIEHPYNPLHCLLQITSVLQHDGLLLLSTPLFKPHLLWSKNHYHELSYPTPLPPAGILRPRYTWGGPSPQCRCARYTHPEAPASAG